MIRLFAAGPHGSSWPAGLAIEAGSLILVLLLLWLLTPKGFQYFMNRRQRIEHRREVRRMTGEKKKKKKS